ncbi:response regulator transcription factor [Roseateles sp. P5_E11]
MSGKDDIGTLVMHEDPVFEAGLLSILGDAPGLRLLPRPAYGVDDDSRWQCADETAEVHLVVADYRRGMAWLEQAKRSCSSPSPRVVIMTSLEGEREVRAALATGVAGLLAQGCAVDEVRQAAITVVRGARYISPAVGRQLADSLVHDTLSEREISVLTLIAAGMCNKEIARHLDISVATVKSHVSSVLEKLGVSSRTQAVSMAGQRRLITPPGHGRAAPVTAYGAGQGQFVQGA